MSRGFGNFFEFKETLIKSILIDGFAFNQRFLKFVSIKEVGGVIAETATIWLFCNGNGLVTVDSRIFMLNY